MTDVTQDAIPGRRILGMNMSPGIGGFHISVLFLIAWTGIMTATFIAASQAYLFTEFLSVDMRDHGRLAGDLAFWGEVIFIAVAGIWGAMSDKIGRRRVMSMAFALMAFGVLGYAYSTNMTILYISRLIFAAGGAAYSVMIVALIADYAQQDSRGRLTGYHGMFNGLGAIATVFFFAKIPSIAQGMGADPIAAGRYMYYSVFIIGIIVSLAAWFGLNKNEGKAVEENIPMKETLREGFIAGKQPRIALAYGSAFLSRANIAVVGSFFILWVTNYGTEIGMDRAEAFARGGMIIGIAQFFAFLGAPVFGILCDRMDRINALIVSLVFSAIGYCSAYFITDPFGVGMIFCAALIGIGEVGTIITSATLIAQEAPSRIRGAVIGFFTLVGAFGIMSAAKVGGYVFDAVAPSAPFVVFGLVAIVILVWAMIVQKKYPRSADSLAADA